jgi:hypothetical protein
MYMSEDYNSPQSVYWCLKALVIVALPADDQFWGSQEESQHNDERTLGKGPMHLLSDHKSGNHHFLLNISQFDGWPIKGGSAKYSKFAYSSSFGFSVPTGARLQQLVPDNMLVISKDGGDTWAAKGKHCAEAFIGTAVCYDAGLELEKVPALHTTWWPWADREVEIHSTLVPPLTKWPDWHIRVHRISASRKARLRIVEGAFAIQGRTATDLYIGDVVLYIHNSLSDNEQAIEGVSKSRDAAVVVTSAGASGISRLSQVDSCPSVASTNAAILKPDANTNLMTQRTVLPILSDTVEIDAKQELILITAIFASSSEPNSMKRTVGVIKERNFIERWIAAPTVILGYRDNFQEDVIYIRS